MSSYRRYTDWLNAQHDLMVQMLIDWAEINSGTGNLEGLAEMRRRIADQIAPISDAVDGRAVRPQEAVDALGRIVPVDLGQALYAERRPNAPRQVLLAIHMDTVYGKESPFQKTTRIDENTLRGPAVADAKGGLVVLLFALMVLERFVDETGRADLGWRVLINADEEIGSPGSAELFKAVAAEVDFALLFEPSLPDGRLISSRNGSGNFSLVVRGKSSHAGRDFHQGRNAVVAAAQITTALHELNGRWGGTTVNVSRIDGGTAPNMVPDVAVVRFNVRCPDVQTQREVETAIAALTESCNQLDGISAELHGSFAAPPKPLTPAIEQLLSELADCGKRLGLQLSWHPSGGVCDGNRLAAWGVPNVDTLGVRGGEIHSPNEFVLLDSLTERARLSALLLMRIADGSVSCPRREG